ncbi:MAG: HIT domain-containing protein [Nanoarchaeota archaeon]|nr:HIT domain-containing protein [Nanoarchaeota archaeon]MBU4086913.1 HIT domain-containing protein [Nanoarchaeota archaeon]
MSEECIFCKIARKEIEIEVIFESDNFVAFPDANPCSKGHTLIIPKKHFVNYLDLPAVLGSELLDVIKKVAEIQLREGAEGFNIIVNNGKEAGQVVMHSHTHLIPRRKGEKARVSFPCAN